MEFLATIGLEVHVRLRTATKLFCRCENRFGAPPNTLVCEVCLGYPGALPVLNRLAVDQALKLALALGCEIADRSWFVRKHYFYPDQPKGYQITQQDRPLARRGRLKLTESPRWVGIDRVQLEEDAGRLLHPEAPPTQQATRIDFNRAGVPLAEVVSAPELSTPEQARDFVQTLQQVIRLSEVGDASLARGALRCDANVSLRRSEDSEPGIRTEIKNLNSLRSLTRALRSEIERQRSRLERGEPVHSQTRHFQESTGCTIASRDKEEWEDYRFLVEPDLPPLTVDDERVATVRQGLGPTPWQLEERLEVEYGLPVEVARMLSADEGLREYFEEAVVVVPDHAAALADWVRTELQHLRKNTGCAPRQVVSPVGLARLVDSVERGHLSRRSAQELLAEVAGRGDDPIATAARLGLDRPLAGGPLEALVAEVLESHASAVEDYRSGHERVLEFFVGEVMGRSRGRADVSTVREMLQRRLSRHEVESSGGGEAGS